MDDLHDDFLWHLFLRLDFLELDNIRRTSPRFEALVLEDAFLRAYNREGRGSVWNFMHFYNPWDRRDNRIVGQREEDGAIVYNIEDFGINLEQELGDDIELIGAFRNILLFVSLHRRHWCLMCNLVTMASRVAHLPYWNQMGLADFELGTRIVEDPEDPLHYIFLFAFVAYDHFRGGMSVNYFTFRSNPHNQLFPPVGRATETDYLTTQERRHPLYMFLPDMEGDIARFLSIRNTRPIYVIEADEYVYDQIQVLPQLPNIWLPEFAPFQYEHHNNEGFSMIVEGWQAQIQGIRRFRFGRLRLFEIARHSYVLRLLSMVPNDRIPDEMFTLTEPMLNATYEGHVELSYRVVNLHEPNMWQRYIFRYKIASQIWTQRLLAMPLDDGLTGGRNFSVRVGMMLHI